MLSLPMARPACALLVLALGVLGSGCARTLYPGPENVTPERDGRFWVVGTEGYARYWDGGRYHVRDYPTEGEPDWAYSPSFGSPAAQVVSVGGEPFLFTRVGEVLRWDGRGWQRRAVRLPGTSYDGSTQVDAVRELASGELALQIHSDTLYVGTLAGFEHDAFAKEKTPTYFTWLGRLGGELWGIGWDTGGEVRALERRTAPGSWELVLRLGRDKDLGEPLCALRGGDGRPFVVTERAIVRSPPSTGEAPPLTAVLPVLPPVAEGAAVARQMPADGAAAYVARCYPANEGARALLLLGATSPGRDANVLELRDGGLVAWHCDRLSGYEAVGAVPGERGWTVVTRDLGRTEVPGPSCRPAKGPLVQAR
ncbi:MAG: hypothetical protein HY908_31675 [Myxococcales bacterium]|nr:hypothetical protein [Myxococcales bacterium]